MLSDEEKELVEKIQNRNKIGIYELIRTFKREGIENFITVRRKYIDIMINLIEKQSKEIEELKKDKLELINKNHVVHLKDVEKELREMKKVIDTKNAEIECLNVIHESYKEMVEENNFISKDKIKAKIEDKESQINDIKDNLDYDEVMVNEVRRLENEIEVLQSLLDKE